MRSRTKGKQYSNKQTPCLSYNPLTRADRNTIEDLTIYADQSSSDIFRYSKRLGPGTRPQSWYRKSRARNLRGRPGLPGLIIVSYRMVVAVATSRRILATGFLLSLPIIPRFSACFLYAMALADEVQGAELSVSCTSSSSSQSIPPASPSITGSSGS